MFEKRYVFSISSLKLQLDNDGVLRLYFTRLPSCFFDGIDISKISDITGHSYRFIYEPWITIAYILPDFLNKAIKEITNIEKYFNSTHINLQIMVDRVALIKYYDNAFRAKDVMCSIKLRECSYAREDY